MEEVLIFLRSIFIPYLATMKYASLMKAQGNFYIQKWVYLVRIEYKGVCFFFFFFELSIKVLNTV